MRVSKSISSRTIAVATLVLVATCGGSDPSGLPLTATLSGVVTATTGAVIGGASVSTGSATATTGGDGRFELQNLPVGSATITTSAAGFAPRSESVSLIAGTNTHNVVLTPTATAAATLTGVVSATTGAAIEGASVSIGSATATTGGDGRYELQSLPVGNATISTSAPGFIPRSESVSLIEGANTHDVVLTPTGEWGLRAPLLESNSELALAEANGKLYLLGGYPASRQTARTVQVYDIASDRWELGP